jgi:hypothetical protein
MNIDNIYSREKTLKTEKEKIELSKYENVIPMFDIYNYSVQLINKNDVYNKLSNYHFRFIDQNIYNWLISKEKKLKEKRELIAEKHKILANVTKSIKFLNNYNFEILNDTSKKVLFKYSPQLGLNTTMCQRNSFNPYFKHLKPYYTKNELINLGKNMGLKIDLHIEDLLDPDVHYDICKKVSKNDVSNKVLFGHTKYIFENEGVYMIKYYSLYGSYFLNKMLRSSYENTKKIGNKSYPKILIDLSKNMQTLIKNAPEMDKDYFIYRFVTSDDYIKDLNIGDYFIDPGFVSATRDPFYNAGSSQIFGMILIKIHIPKGKKGVGLFVENFSHFVLEQEIIFNPFSKFKLISINKNFKYYHINKQFENRIQTKYEFIYEESLDQDINIPISTLPILDIDFINADIEGSSLLQKLEDLTNRFFNKNREIKINDIVFYYQWFDSYSEYSKFYQNKTKHGLNLVSYNSNVQPNLWIEFGENMFINYYNKFNQVTDLLKDDKIIDIVSKIAYKIGYKNAFISCNYVDFTRFKNNYPDATKKYLMSHSFCFDFYNYLKNGIKRFDEADQVHSIFSWWKLDMLKRKKVDILVKNDRSDWLNYILENNKITTCSDLYIIVIEKYFDKYLNLEKRLSLLYEKDTNPFILKYFELDTYQYLYNLNIIDETSFYNTDDVIKNIIYSKDDYMSIYREKQRSQ